MNRNLIQQIRKNQAKWNSYYNHQNNLIKQEDYVFRNDSFYLSQIISLEYDNDGKKIKATKISPSSSRESLLRQVSYSYELDSLGNLIPLEERFKNFEFNEEDKIFSVINYEYDKKGNPVKSTETKKLWSYQMNEIPKRIYRVEVTTYEYDELNNLTKKCISLEDKDEPYRCYEYIYEYQNK